jgi:hypothetical protein
MPCHQDSEQNNDIEVVNISFKNVAKSKYFRRTATNQNFIHEEINNKLKSGKVCFHSVQNRLSSPLPYKTIKIQIYRALILPVVLYGCKT